LLIIGPGQLPPGVTFAQSEFPVMLRLGGACHECRLALGGMECRHLQRVLMELANEIYLRKANQLSCLLDRYFAGVASFNYVSTLRVDRDGATLDVPVEHIHALEASGNYVRLYAASGTYELRETISGLSARLEPSIFVRVHRSYVVNLHHVTLSRLEDSSPQITLSSGKTVPIGPNFRADISRLLADRLKLTA
jgi:DNA-binding LytR/AlgR family response regulator